MRERRQSFAARKPRGLTFGEMLIVLAVFSILAAMFIISSRFAINKSRVSRVLHEQREIVGRLDLYVSDNSQIPSETQGLNALLRDPRGISYMDSIPIDPFAAPKEGETGQYLYFSKLSPQRQAIVVSVGPDGQSDIGPALDALRKARVTLAGAGAPAYLFKTPQEEEAFISQHTYDPTNGTDSRGDIIHFYGAPGVLPAN